MLTLKHLGATTLLVASIAMPATAAAQVQDLRSPDRQFPSAPAQTQDLRNADRRAAAPVQAQDLRNADRRSPADRRSRARRGLRGHRDRGAGRRLRLGRRRHRCGGRDRRPGDPGRIGDGRHPPASRAAGHRVAPGRPATTRAALARAPPVSRLGRRRRIHVSGRRRGNLRAWAGLALPHALWSPWPRASRKSSVRRPEWTRRGARRRAIRAGPAAAFVKSAPGRAGARPPVRRENPRRWSLPGLTPALLGATEPVEKYGAGTCGTVDCCLEREDQTHRGRPPPGDVHG